MALLIPINPHRTTSGHCAHIHFNPFSYIVNRNGEDMQRGILSAQLSWLTHEYMVFSLDHHQVRLTSPYKFFIRPIGPVPYFSGEVCFQNLHLGTSFLMLAQKKIELRLKTSEVKRGGPLLSLNILLLLLYQKQRGWVRP